VKRAGAQTKTLGIGRVAKNHPLYRHSHQWIDAVDLAMARRIAEKIHRSPGLMKIARENLRHWKKVRKSWPRCLREWEEILEQNPTDKILAILTQDNDEGQRLRQSDPFVGILTDNERTWFLEKYEPE
jgi:hypothetical protein